MKYKEEMKLAFKVSIPVLMGYCILGFAFGLLMVSMKYDIIIPILMSIFIYAGALQFLAIGFFSAKLALFDVFIASLFVNIRQAFYGLSVLDKFKDSKNLKPYNFKFHIDNSLMWLVDITNKFKADDPTEDKQLIAHG